MVLLLLACHAPTPNDSVTDSGTDSGSDSATTDSETHPAAVITLQSPSDGASIDASAVELAWTVENFSLSWDHAGGVPVEGEGHVHLYDNGIQVGESGDLSYTLSGLHYGSHTLEVRLAGNDHAELGPTASATISVTEPSVRILNPPGDLPGSSIQLSLDLEGLTLDPLGSTPQDGHGHLQLWVDGSMTAEGTDPTGILASRLTEGTHALEVWLVQNDGTPIQAGGTCGVDNLSCAHLDVNVPAGVPYLEIQPVDPGSPSATLQMKLTAQNFRASDLLEGANLPGVGHFHVYVDGAFFQEAFDLKSYVYHFPGGTHLVEVRTAEIDHTEDGAADEEWVSIDPNPWDIWISSPTPDQVTGSTVPVTIATQNFSLVDPSVNPVPAAGEGHYLLMVDYAYNYEPFENTYTLNGLASGDHYVQVELLANDGTELDPVVSSETIHFSVP